MSAKRIGVIVKPVHPTRDEIRKAIDEHFEKLEKGGMSRQPKQSDIKNYKMPRETKPDDQDYNPKPKENRQKM